MRSQWMAWKMRLAPSLARVFAMVATFTFHVVLVAALIRETDVPPLLFQPQSMDLQLDFEILPPPLPPKRPLKPNAADAAAVTAKPRQPDRREAARISAKVVPDTADATISEPPPTPTSFQSRVDHQRREVAADIARENAPKRRAFAGRSIDGMLPDGETGILPSFRPETQDDNRDTARKIMQMLSRSLPRSATDYDAPVDPLTERWEDAHHSSDMADCDLKYARFDAQMRRELCGFVRPPE